MGGVSFDINLKRRRDLYIYGIHRSVVTRYELPQPANLHLVLKAMYVLANVVVCVLGWADLALGNLLTAEE